MRGAIADSEFKYAGSELELFEKARNWKAYWRAQIARFVRGEVLEVGAGIGSNTLTLAGLDYERWTCLEPDAALAARIAALIEVASGGRHKVAAGTIDDLPAEAKFDAILYIDVLEHIEDDRAEMARAAGRLKPGGALIVLAPAHPFLFTPFDTAIGHFRRYTRASLRAAVPRTLRLEKLVYLDTAGMLASAANRLLLQSSMPTERQILTWDRLLVPVSRVIDPVFAGRVGKSVLGVWRAEK
ncbi:MAG: methyltransferase family protein [Bryobacterales bacterium]|jgi:SAM-dependent methyltransferase|nr:methyltransferase family protein [Bryobacterales bacterium]